MRSAFFFWVFTQTTNLKASQSISKQPPKIHPRCDREENSEEIFEDWKCIFCSRPKIFGCSIYALEVERLLVYWEGGFVCPAQLVGLGSNTCAWGSCIIHCNQVIEEHMEWGVLEMNFSKDDSKSERFSQGVWRELQKSGLFFELSTLDIQTSIKKIWYWFFQFAFTKKVQENHQRKQSWGPNSCIIFHTTKWCDLYFSSRSPSHSAEAPSNPWAENQRVTRFVPWSGCCVFMMGSSAQHDPHHDDTSFCI